MNITEGEFEKKESKLYSKKLRLFQEQKPQMWEMHPDDIKMHPPGTLQADKNLALPLMLYKVGYYLQCFY